MSVMQQLYDKSPYYVQSVLFNLYAYKIHWRYGERFERKLEELEQRERLSRSDLVAYQEEQLMRLLDDVYKNVPFYSELMRSRKLKPSDFLTIDDLAKLPIITKAQVRDNSKLFLNTRFNHKTLFKGATSGTTGSPLTLFYDKEAFLLNNVFDWRQKRWAGIQYGDRIAFLLGRPIVSLGKRCKPFWQKDIFHNHIWLSAFHMGSSNLLDYAEEISRYGAKAIEGYPSTVYVLAKFLEDRGLKLPLKAVFVSSEPLHDFQRATIERSFACKVFNFYGMAERVVFATECDRHDGMHLNYEYGISEVTSKAVAEDIENSPNKEGVLTATGLINKAMPLIRYQTNDLALFDTDNCGCGRNSIRIPKVETKLEDMIIRADGTPISPSVLTHPFKSVKGIRSSQIIQESSSHITVMVVEAGDSPSFDAAALKEGLQLRVGKEFSIQVRSVEDIPRERSGKFRWVINRSRSA